MKALTVSASRKVGDEGSQSDILEYSCRKREEQISPQFSLYRKKWGFAILSDGSEYQNPTVKDRGAILKSFGVATSWNLSETNKQSQNKMFILGLRNQKKH
jgi:hypothetical protein